MLKRKKKSDSTFRGEQELSAVGGGGKMRGMIGYSVVRSGNDRLSCVQIPVCLKLLVL